MKLSKISVIAAMVLGGLVAGSTIVRAADDATPKGKGKGNRMTVEQTLEKLTTELTLTDAQKPKVKEVLEDTSKKRQELMADSSTPQDERRTKFRALMDDQEKKLKEILTPDQMEKYKKWAEENRGKGGGKKKKAE
jgi:periplasmic protein CpxP/Spy